MLDNIRYKLGTYYMKKADEQIKNRKLKKAFKNIKKSVRIVPYSDELSQFAKDLYDISIKSVKKN